MQFNWLNFTIDLPSLLSYVQSITDKSDGIITNSQGFTIVESLPFDSSEQLSINNYIQSLTEAGEAFKASKRNTIRIKIISFLEEASNKPFASLHPIEKKLINKVALTDEEQEFIYEVESLNGSSEIDIDLSSIPIEGPEEMQATTLNDAINELTSSIVRSAHTIVFQFIGQMNSDQYLVSGAHSVAGLLTSTRRSGNASNGYRYENSSPSIAIHTGKVISASASIRGVAHSAASPAPQVQLKFELWKVGFVNEGVKLGDIIFNIQSSNYTLGTWWNSSVSTNFAENQLQNVAVTAGDLLALKYIKQEGNDKVVSVENTTIVLEIKKDTL